MVLLTDVVYPLIKVTYGGADEFRGSEEIDAEQFIAVKGFKAKGKRISTWQIESIEELEPVRFPEEPEEPETPDTPDSPVEQEVPDTPDSPAELETPEKRFTGEELSLFDDEA
jgi:topoisomerase-4 subunit A